MREITASYILCKKCKAPLEFKHGLRLAKIGFWRSLINAVLFISTWDKIRADCPKCHRMYEVDV
jgi:hypothetical protein